ncbi:hypothetical protein L596_010174 [Steinernema carpocapsae]|uniref:Uncharacterized protein n=1 Tax=Steinernema carpocapsae TaxID=34508 RepID=A0A4U5PHU5_STECR|nr:hypothetical protein L596_010174 [Steinernema carpocapsae]
MMNSKAVLRSTSSSPQCRDLLRSTTASVHGPKICSDYSAVHPKSDVGLHSISDRSGHRCRLRGTDTALQFRHRAPLRQRRLPRCSDQGSLRPPEVRPQTPCAAQAAPLPLATTVRRSAPVSLTAPPRPLPRRLRRLDLPLGGYAASTCPLRSWPLLVPILIASDAGRPPNVRPIPEKSEFVCARPIAPQQSLSVINANVRLLSVAKRAAPFS